MWWSLEEPSVPRTSSTVAAARTKAGTAKDRRRRAAWAVGWWVLAGGVVAGLLGCDDDRDAVRRIERRAQQRLADRTAFDDLGEASDYLERWAESDPDEARRQIKFHLNRWSRSREGDDVAPPAVAEALTRIRRGEAGDALRQRLVRGGYDDRDVDHLRDVRLFHRMTRWIGDGPLRDPLWDGWLSTLAEGDRDRLSTTLKLFDWTVRNVAIEPDRIPNPGIPDPPGGRFKFDGPGYRQTVYQTAMRGSGDALQRAELFIRLCRQAGSDAFAIAASGDGSTDPTPFAVGVLIGDDVYLFEPRLGIPIPGPDSVGVATLRQARRDASVMRRLTVPGFFEYPLSKSDVQSVVALVPATPESLSPRMRRLQQALTGNRRMSTHVAWEPTAERIDAASGISGVRLWDQPVASEEYAEMLRRMMDRDARLAAYVAQRWLMIESPVPASRTLALGRYRQLVGRFDAGDAGESDGRGARELLLRLRQPEFEIEDLRTDPQLQKKYDLRRQLGMPEADFDRQIGFVQELLRQGKRTATYWLSLIQYEDGMFDNAVRWLDDRVLDAADGAEGRWNGPAYYNLARAHEAAGRTDDALRLYRREGLATEHGARIRARLLSRQTDDDL